MNDIKFKKMTEQLSRLEITAGHNNTKTAVHYDFLRTDIAKKSSETAEILKNANAISNDCFIIPRII